MNYNLKDIYGLQALSGDTNQAYVGYLDEKKVFIKKNSTPFFIAVANEDLAPHLVWSKNIDGSLWLAQEWIEGQSLKRTDVMYFKDQLMGILSKLHKSDYLALMLYRLEGREMEPIDFLQEYYWQLPRDLENDWLLSKVYRELEDNIPEFNHLNICACHGDLNHKNMMFKDINNQEIYVIDWDSAILSDVFGDLGTVLYRYVYVHLWDDWLRSYGLFPDEESIQKIWWYGEMQQLMHIKRQYQKGRMQLVKEEIEHLRIMNEQKEKYYESQK